MLGNIFCKIGLHWPMKCQAYLFNDFGLKAVYKSKCPCGHEWLVYNRGKFPRFKVLYSEEARRIEELLKDVHGNLLEPGDVVKYIGTDIDYEDLYTLREIDHKWILESHEDWEYNCPLGAIWPIELVRKGS